MDLTYLNPFAWVPSGSIRLLLLAVLSVYLFARGFSRPAVLVYALIVFIPLSLHFPASTWYGLNTENVFFVMITLVWLGTAASNTRGTFFESTPLTTPILVLVAITLASFVNLIGGGYDTSEVMSSFRFFVSGFFVFLATVHLIHRKEEVRRAVFLTAGMIAFVAYLGFLEHLRSGSGVRLVGLIGQENQFGAFLAESAPFLIALLKFDLSRRAKWSLRLALLSVIYLLLFTQSRGAWIAFVVAGAYLAVRLDKKIAVVGLTGAAVVALAVGLPTPISHRLGTLYDEQNEEYVLEKNTRLEIWKASVSVIATHPIWGTGYTSFRREIEQVYGQPKNAHNMYLTILAETGLVGLICFCAIFVQVFVMLARARRVGDPELTAFAQGMAAATLALLIVNVFGTRFLELPTNGLYWICLGLVYRYCTLLSPGMTAAAITARPPSLIRPALPARAQLPRGIRGRPSTT
jgi:O-antigen ligase